MMLSLRLVVARQDICTVGWRIIWTKITEILGLKSGP